MARPQVGIFALGTSAHCYLEFDRRSGVSDTDFVRAVAELEEPHASLGGVNLVLGVRPELWAVVSDDHDSTVTGFNAPVRGADVEMPATQRDAFVWIAGSAQDVVFDVAHSVIAEMRTFATVASHDTGWAYQHNRDLTGFIDGTENPSQVEAPLAALIPDGRPGAGGSVLLIQKWVHDHDKWAALPVEEQERVIGRTKPDSVEFDDAVKPPDSHVARNVIEDSEGNELKIFRRNAPYGDPVDYGTMFVGFSTDQHRLSRMLDRMAGVEGGVIDALTKYTHAVSGSYYFVPSIEALLVLAPRTES
jgi:putative iron-dependent peroxidase